MADKRAYFKLDVGYLTNPKVAAVGLQSPSAVLLHIGSIGYAAQHLTDGEVPVPLLLRLTGATSDDADLLYASGLWEVGRQDGLAVVHDYLRHQRSADEVKNASDAGKKGAASRWGAKGNAKGNADRMPTAEGDASESGMRTPMPREEREEREETTSPRASLTLAETPRPDVDQVCNLLADRIEDNGSKRPTITKGWRDAARLMIDRDGRTVEEIVGAIEWCQRDEFWRGNVLSMPKLREKYDQLRLQAQRRTGQAQRNDIDWDLAMDRARAMGGAR